MKTHRSLRISLLKSNFVLEIVQLLFHLNFLIDFQCVEIVLIYMIELKTIFTKKAKFSLQ